MPPTPRRQAPLALAAFGLLLSGCVGPGGAGGSVWSDPTAPDGVFYAASGAGMAGGFARAGPDGCDLTLTAQEVRMCGTALHVEGARFEVTAVNASAPMYWSDVALATIQAGAMLESGARSVPFGTRANFTAAPDMAGPVWMPDLGSLLRGEVAVGQSFEVCTAAGGEVTLWLWDRRPTGVVLGFALQPPTCGQAVAVARPIALVQGYDVGVLGARAGPVQEQRSSNCVEVPAQAAPWQVELLATWRQDQGVALGLELVVVSAGGTWTATGDGPVRLEAGPFPAGEGVRFGVRPTEPGVAWQDVRITVQYLLSAPLEGQPAPCTLA